MADHPPTTDRYGRAIYTQAQIKAFFDRVAFTPDEADLRLSLDFLASLQKHFLASIPFESLSLHYSQSHVVSIDPQAVFTKIVGKVNVDDGSVRLNAEKGEGRGGYCMENSLLFGTIMRTLGYNTYPTGARVNEAVQPIAASKSWRGPKFDGWNHMINIVTIEGKQYFVDVGFGSSGPHHPIPLEEGYTSANVGTQSLRLIRETPPDLLTKSAAVTSTAQHLWQYEFRHADDKPWLPAYCFSGTEFSPNDFVMMNHFTSTSRSSWFTYMVICMKMVMENNELVGDVTMAGPEVKRRVSGSSTTLAILESEQQRIEALAKYFGIKLSAEERIGIQGMSSELV